MSSILTLLRNQEALAQLMQDGTNVIIAHSLSPILNSDRIAVMHHGRIIDIGPHDQLLKRCDVYANLYHKQYCIALAS